MLGKLMKYEIKSCGRTFFPLYIVTLLFSICSGLFINFDNGAHNFELVYAIGALIAFALFVAMIVITIVLIVQRFNKNFLEDEGYLMFTLPVSEKTLVLSKLLTSLLFIILTSIVSIISISIVGMTASYSIREVLDIGYIVGVIGDILVENLGSIIFYIFSMIVDFSLFILTIYLAITISHLPVFSKHKVISGLGALIVLSIIQTVIIDGVGLIMVDTLTEQTGRIAEELILQDPFNVQGFFKVVLSISSYQIVYVLVNLVMSIASFFGISYLLEKKLNLE